jgi:hypothetical protein
MQLKLLVLSLVLLTPACNTVQQEIEDPIVLRFVDRILNEVEDEK